MTKRYVSVLTLAFAGAGTAFAQITLNSVPSRSIGSPALNISSLNPNLVEGREFYAPQSVAVDTSGPTPILYVSDTGNNRVLAWKNANSFQSGQVADLQIGQPDLLTTFPGGPGTAYTTGLNQPTGIAVDSNGNLYVVDSGNNRVLRYPSPFTQVTQQQKQFPVPDLWIGQATLNTRVINYTGQATPNAQGIYLTNGSTALQSSIAFDSSGNLWVTDAGNLRVLEFKAADLVSGGGGLTAILELGQNDFVSTQTPLNSGNLTAQLVTNQFFLPDALAFDPSGNLFVTDFNANVSRVMVFTPPFTTGMSATRLMGVFPSGFVPPTSATAAQALADNTLMAGPEAVFFITGSTPAVGVVDSGSSRIMLFSAYANWPADGVTPPQAQSIYGQPNLCPTQQTGLPSYALCRYPNNGLPRPAAYTLYSAGGAFFTGTDLFVADSGNNRVIDIPLSGNTLPSTGATRVLGQDRLDTNSINLIEGREFQFSNVAGTDSAIAIDATGSVPHLYISDPGNNRVLGFKDLRNLKPGARADIVLGQPDLQTALINYPANDGTKPNSSGLYRPIGLLVDSNGNLYVADSLNGRVLRFPAPFGYTGGSPEPADLVLGQQNFTTKITDATSSDMLAPYGLAFSGVNGLVVSDQGDNRVLYIPMTNGAFAAGSDNGKAATIVFGQQGFNGKAAGSSTTSMNSPHGVSCDSDGFVYVADTGNNRILIFNDPHSSTTPTSGESAAITIPGLNTPQGVFVSLLTGEIWVANTNAGTAVRYANYNSVALGNGVISTIQEVSGGYLLHPLAVALDQYGDLYVADDADRVAFYYPGLTPMNGANFLINRALAPGVVATLKVCTNCGPNQFGATTASLTNYPMPILLANTEVLFNGTPAPLYFVSPGQINFLVPNLAPTSGTADVEVVQVSTGQVLGATLVQMQPVSPGIFENPGGQNGTTRYAAVINQDNTINTPSNPAARGSVISIYATGQGYVPGAPPDGTPINQLAAPAALTVYLNAADVNSWPDENFQHILYSGLDQYPGMWQINVQIPKDVPPSSSTNGSTQLAIIVGGVVNFDISQGWYTVIAVK